MPDAYSGSLNTVDMNDPFGDQINDSSASEASYSVPNHSDTGSDIPADTSSTVDSLSKKMKGLKLKSEPPSIKSESQDGEIQPASSSDDGLPHPPPQGPPGIILTNEGHTHNDAPEEVFESLKKEIENEINEYHALMNTLPLSAHRKKKLAMKKKLREAALRLGILLKSDSLKELAMANPQGRRDYYSHLLNSVGRNLQQA